MTRETDPNTSFIGDFSNTGGIIDYPETDGSLLVSELDDQVRDAKQMVYNTLKNCDGEVTSTHTELNYVDGVAQNLALWTKGKTASGLAVATGDSGDPNTYTLTTGLSHTLADGDAFTFQVDEASINASLLQVDSNTARNLVDKNGDNIQSGDLSVDSIIEVRYDASATKFYVIGGFCTPPPESSSGDPTVTNYTTGSGNFTASIDGTHIFRLIGGGGGGGDGGTGSNNSSGGGGGGEFLEVTLTLTNGDNVAYSVGAGGSGGLDANGSAGGNTTVTYAGTTYTANGGGGGLAGGNGGTGGSGGTGGGGVGGTPEPTTTNDGGNGGNGLTGTTHGGSGGSGGGNAGPGNNGFCIGESPASGGDGSSGATNYTVEDAITGPPLTDGEDGVDATTPPTKDDVNSGSGGSSDNNSGHGPGNGGLYGSGGGGGIGQTGGGILAGGNGANGVISVVYFV